jgi:hypothetical protein
MAIRPFLVAPPDVLPIASATFSRAVVCANVLQIFGVRPDVVPARPKMGPMIAALAEYFQVANR